MIHYHGTPITPKAKLLRMAGRHFCVSFAASYQLRTCLQIGQSVMLDNGAFSAKTLGKVFDREKCFAWMEPHLAHPHWAVIPDVIDGDVEAQRDGLRAWPFGKELGAPVWHLGLPIDYMLEMADNYPRICFGSAGEFWQVGTPKWAARMDAAFNALAKARQRLPWIHGLRMLGQTDGGWPLASADSTNVAQNFHLYGCPECMADRIDRTQPPIHWNPREEQCSLF